MGSGFIVVDVANNKAFTFSALISIVLKSGSQAPQLSYFPEKV